MHTFIDRFEVQTTKTDHCEIIHSPNGAFYTIRDEKKYDDCSGSAIHTLSLTTSPDGALQITTHFYDSGETHDFLAKLLSIPLQANLAQERVHTEFLANNSAEVLTYLRLLYPKDKRLVEIIGDVCRILEIKEKLELTMDMLLAMPVDIAIKAAIDYQLCQTTPTFQLIEQLFSFYWTQSLPKPTEQRSHSVSLAQLYALATAISPSNPFYKGAQDYCLEILRREDLECVQSDEPQSLDEESASDPRDYYSRLALKFKHALNGSDQYTTDTLYKELCGKSMSETAVKNIHGDYDTLIALATDQREFRQALYKTPTASKGHSPQFFNVAEEKTSNPVPPQNQRTSGVKRGREASVLDLPMEPAKKMASNP